MRVRRGTRRAWLVLGVLGLLSVACSEDLEVAAPSAILGREAAGADTSPNIDEFCSAGTFPFVRNITVCFVLRNETAKFTAPDVLGGKFALTVPRGDCEKLYAEDICQETGGYYGSIRSQNLGNVYGRRVLTPDPFTNIGAIQFQPDEIWQGVDVRLYVGSNTPPFTTNQAMAQPEFEIPTAGKNGGNCKNQGEFIACELIGSSWSTAGNHGRPQYRFTTKPLRIQISNTTKHPMLLRSSSHGAGFLPDPVAIANVEAIPGGNGVAFVGGYRSVSGGGEQSYSASYCLDTSKTADSIVPGEPPPKESPNDCIRIELKISIGVDANGKPLNQSTCIVPNPPKTLTIKCPQPTLDPDGTLASVSVS